jgi:hypothetical protein
MFLKDAMIESRGCPFGPECEMHREVITDLKMVYYRGRYRAATVWSKIGRTSAGENPSIVEVDNSGQAVAANRGRKTGPGLQPAA